MHACMYVYVYLCIACMYACIHAPRRPQPKGRCLGGLCRLTQDRLHRRPHGPSRKAICVHEAVVQHRTSVARMSCMNMYIHVNISVYIYIGRHMYTLTLTHIQYTDICIFVYVYVHVYFYIYVCILSLKTSQRVRICIFVHDYMHIDGLCNILSTCRRA